MQLLAAPVSKHLLKSATAAMAAQTGATASKLSVTHEAANEAGVSAQHAEPVVHDHPADLPSCAAPPHLAQAAAKSEDAASEVEHSAEAMHEGACGSVQSSQQLSGSADGRTGAPHPTTVINAKTRKQRHR